MKAQVYQSGNSWTARTRYGKSGFECGGSSRQDALNELVLMVKAFTGEVVEIDEVEIIELPSILKSEPQQLALNLKFS